MRWTPDPEDAALVEDSSQAEKHAEKFSVQTATHESLVDKLDKAQDMPASGSLAEHLDDADRPPRPKDPLLDALEKPADAASRSGENGTGGDSYDDVVALMRQRRARQEGDEKEASAESGDVEEGFTQEAHADPDEEELAPPWLTNWAPPEEEDHPETEEIPAPVASEVPADAAPEMEEELPAWSSGTDEPPVAAKPVPSSGKTPANEPSIENAPHLAASSAVPIAEAGKKLAAGLGAQVRAKAVSPRPPLIERPAFWHAAWAISGVLSLAGGVVVWMWFGALVRVWPALGLL